MNLCILPWINFSTTTLGRPRVCGYSDDAVIKRELRNLKNSSIDEEWNNNYFRQIRLDFLNNKWPDNCKRCEYVESLGGKSKRLDENGFYYERYKHLIKQTNVDGNVSYSPPNIDVRTGTVCNLKCIHCGTGASSKWQEDTLLLNRYPNTEKLIINNKWIEQDDSFWNYLRNKWGKIEKYNFLGGESFANKQHNKFIKDLSETEHAKNVYVSYTTNALFLDEHILNQLSNFRKVSIRVSLDAIGKQIEYFRFPTKWDSLQKKLELLNSYNKLHEKNKIDDDVIFDISIQWTCSNISLFYLTETYEYVKHLKNLQFRFLNHVEWPIHMSAQNLPLEIKNRIAHKIENYTFFDNDLSNYKFYVKHMFEKDLWSKYGPICLSYFDDLDKARGCNWKQTFKEMFLEQFDER